MSRVIQTPAVIGPRGVYIQAVQRGDTLHIAGRIGNGGSPLVSRPSEDGIFRICARRLPISPARTMLRRSTRSISHVSAGRAFRPGPLGLVKALPPGAPFEAVGYCLRQALRLFSADSGSPDADRQ